MNAKHTAGEWRFNGRVIYSIAKPHADIATINTTSAHFGDDEPAANGFLIAEAGTVASESGLSPRQLLEQRDELLKACERALLNMKRRQEMDGNQNFGQTIEILQSAIAKAKGQP